MGTGTTGATGGPTGTTGTTGGPTNPTTGGSTPGGSSTGGSSTVGSTTGGFTTGGLSTVGSTTGGFTTGGSTTGGSSTLGSSTLGSSTIGSTTEGSSGCTLEGFEDDGNGNCFRVITEKANHNKAGKECRKLGNAELASVLDSDANGHLAEILNGNTWIGGQNNGGTWEWVNGENWDFENWKNGEGENDGECAAMQTNGKWRDSACTVKLEFACMEI